MREITLADYKAADRQLEREQARRGFTIHAIVYALVMTGLIILNLTVATEFPWAVFPLVCWGIGLTAHYLFGLRWINKAITTGRHGSNSAPPRPTGPPDTSRTSRGDLWTAAGRRRGQPRRTENHHAHR